MLLRVDALRVERGGRVVLRDLSFTLAAGEVVLVTGGNGAGKSTLLRALAGLLPIHGGKLVGSDASDEVRSPETMHYLGYEDALKPALSVRENLAFWAAMLGADSVERQSPDAALAALGLARLIDLPASYLSAGQKRRVALARLLLAWRPIWLLDEPTLALDAVAQGVLAAMVAAHADAGGAILAASHAPLGVASRSIALGAIPGTTPNTILGPTA